MGSKTVILVTGATGMAGSEVCEQLAKIPGIDVRAAVHTPGKRQLLPPEVTAVPFDTEDPATVAAALEGVGRLFLATPGGPFGPVATRVITQAARSRPLERIVKLSSITPDTEPRAPTDLWAIETEAMVRDTGIPYTFLRPPWFDQNFTKGYFVPLLMQRKLDLPFGDGRAGWVDTRDIAAMAVKALLDDGHEGRTYVPTGPDPISLSEIAEILSRVTSRTIRFHHLSDGEWLAASKAAGQPEIVAQATLALIAKTRDGHHEDHISGDVERVTGRRPRSFEQFARDHADLLISLTGTPQD